ncbi:ankyrin repeat domain-containing protein [Myxococcaceae bacterium JPH2]|nr:ankyrin repeat domain-containing protein [Myxococcaceae bacterium JPH2]
MAIESGDLEAAESLVRNGADVNASFDGVTALTLAISEEAGLDESLRRVDCLLRLGARTACESGRGLGSSVHQAAKVHFVPVLNALLQADGRSRLNTFDDCEQTPLMCAVDNRDLEVARILLDAGADVNARNEERIGDPAINLPLRKRSLDDLDVAMVAMLVSRGANPRQAGWMKMSALDYLAQWRERMGNAPLVGALARALGAP